MTRIKGINDRNSLDKIGARVKISLFKGTQKLWKKSKSGKYYKSAGSDYETFFRIECSQQRLRNLLIETYSSWQEQEEFKQKEKEILALTEAKYQEEKSLTSIYLKEVRILLAYSSLDKSFVCQKVKRSTKVDVLSGIIHECDGETIYCKHESYQDVFGHTRRKIIDTNEPCPVAGTHEQCPHGCQKEGRLYFWIKEISDREIYDISSIGFTGYTDMIELGTYLDQVEATRGDAVTDLSMYDFSHRICYVLKRKKVPIKRPIFESGKRSGKTTDGHTYALALEIDPDWLEKNRIRNRMEKAIACGYQPSPQLIAAVHEIEVLEAEVIPQQQPLLLSEITSHDIEELRSLWQQHQWTKEGLKKMLDSYFGISLRSEHFQTLTREQFRQLKTAISSEVAREMYC